MTEKDTYRPDELAKALDIKVWKVKAMLRRNVIKHTHTNKTHANARIPKDEFTRLVENKN